VPVNWFWAVSLFKKKNKLVKNGKLRRKDQPSVCVHKVIVPHRERTPISPGIVLDS
jgi:hypothetical protein